MKRIIVLIIVWFIMIQPLIVMAQNQNAKIDSLVKRMRTAGRDWNDFANPLIEIGEAAVPGLIKNAEDKSLPQWNRRIAIMTLNNIHSPVWQKHALTILLNKQEDPELQNHVTAGLRGSNLIDVKLELWELFNMHENQFYKSNVAHLLLTADTALAYKAFCELYRNQDGHIQKNALVNLARLRPNESTSWYLKGIQSNDWMTANLAMDSLIVSARLNADELISVYNKSNAREEIQWRIVYIFGHRRESSGIQFLLEALQNESWLVQNEAAVCLADFNIQQLFDALTELKHDERLHVRKNATWIIKQSKRNN